MAEPKEAQADHVLIKRGLYYRPDGAGYTALKCEAGLYSASYADGLEGVTAIPFADADEFAPAAWEETKVDYYKKHAATLQAENAVLREKLAEIVDIADIGSSAHELAVAALRTGGDNAEG